MRFKKRLLIFTFLATTLALPIPTRKPESCNSVSQHFGKAGLLILTLGGLLTLAAGSIAYGTHWFHRYKSLQASQMGNMTLWRQEQEQRDVEHGKRMEGLEIILDVVRNYTEHLGKEEREGDFGPFKLAGEVERGVEEEQGKQTNLRSSNTTEMSNN